MTLQNKFNNQTFRTLENPPARLKLPPHLQHTVSYMEQRPFARAVREGVEACGLKLHELSHINIAWPQKHPRTGHINKATTYAENLRLALYNSFRKKDVILAHAIYETIKLDRSEDSSAISTLNKKQVYAVDPQLQEQDVPLPFLTPEGAKGQAFILTDWIVSQGTTLANLASFIMHNGGHIIAVAPPFGGNTLLQEELYVSEDVPDVEKTGALPALARAFARAARYESDYTPAECIAVFEEALKPKGLSLSTLTFGECMVLENTMGGRSLSFRDFVTTLGLSPDSQQKIVTARRNAQAVNAAP